MSQNVTKCHTFSNLWYKATFTFYVWIRLGTTLNCCYNYRRNGNVAVSGLCIFSGRKQRGELLTLRESKDFYVGRTSARDEYWYADLNSFSRLTRRRHSLWRGRSKQAMKSWGYSGMELGKRKRIVWNQYGIGRSQISVTLYDVI